MVYIIDTRNGPEKRWECDDLRAILAQELPQQEEEVERVPVRASGLVAVAA